MTEPDQWAAYPLEKGKEWRRIEDGEIVTITKRVGTRTVRYKFANSGSMVTRIARFVRFYEPVTGTQLSATGESSPSVGPVNSERSAASDTPRPSQGR